MRRRESLERAGSCVTARGRRTVAVLFSLFVSVKEVRSFTVNGRRRRSWRRERKSVAAIKIAKECKAIQWKLA